eukprot:1013995-Pyramimonas_sp.AAC.1
MGANAPGGVGERLLESKRSNGCFQCNLESKRSIFPADRMPLAGRQSTQGLATLEVWRKRFVMTLSSFQGLDTDMGRSQMIEGRIELFSGKAG